MRETGRRRQQPGRPCLRRLLAAARSRLVSGCLLSAGASLATPFAKAQQLPPSLPLTQAFGAPTAEGGTPREAVVLTLPLASLWRRSAARPPAGSATRASLANARVNTGLHTSWAVGANVEMAAMHARTGNAALAAPLLGSQGGFAGKPKLSGDDSYLLMDGQRAPLNTVGVDLSYGRTDRAGRGLSIGTSVGMARYAADSDRRVPIGTTHLKLSF